MRRGEVYIAALDPVKGSEASKRRPVVVVSHNALNKIVAERGRGVITVVPLTSNVEVVLSFQLFLPAEVTGLSRDSKAQAEQVRALAYERFQGGVVGVLPTFYIAQLDTALKLHLTLD